MTDKFDAVATAQTMRSQAKVEMHDDSPRGPLLDSLAALSNQQFKEAASVLTATNCDPCAAPRAQIHRENGEIKSLSFMPGRLDGEGNAHSLNLVNDGETAFIAKSAREKTIVSAKELHGPNGAPGRYAEPQIIDWSNQTRHTSVANFGAIAVGASIGRVVTAPALDAFNPAFREMTATGNALRGIAVALGVSSAEHLGADALESRYPRVAEFLRPHPVEAMMIGTASAFGGANWRLRGAVVAGAMIAGKAEYAVEKWMRNR